MNTLKHWFFALLFGLTLLAARPTGLALAFDASSTDAVIALASQTEQDAAQAVTADDINQRIDQSEATTLRLSDDIGEMADRILWTEEQIGIMADRIVESEYLINDGAQQSADQVQETITLVQP